MVLFQQPLVILQQSFIFSLVVNFFRELFEINGMATGNDRDGPWGVIDGGCLIGAYGMQIIDPTGLFVESYALLGVDGYFLLHLSYLRIQQLQFIQEGLVLAHQGLLFLEEGVTLTHHPPLLILHQSHLIYQVCHLLGQTGVVPEGIGEFDIDFTGLQGIVVTYSVQLKLHPAQFLLQSASYLTQFHVLTALQEQFLLQPL